MVYYMLNKQCYLYFFFFVYLVSTIENTLGTFPQQHLDAAVSSIQFSHVSRQTHTKTYQNRTTILCIKLLFFYFYPIHYYIFLFLK